MATANRTYEAMCLFPGGTDPEHATRVVREMIERHGGSVLVLKKWDERKLAYEIKHQKRGLYVICYYSGPGSSISAIERDVNLGEEILRVLLTKADHLTQAEMEAVEPQPVVREERPSWERGGDDRRPRRDDRPRDDRPRDDRPRDERMRDERPRDEKPEPAAAE